MNIELTLELKNINVHLGKRNILQDVSLSFSPGLHFIAGLNGSGKTTLFKTIFGLIPCDGKILFNQKEIAKSDQQIRAKSFAAVHQKISIPFRICVMDFVLMGRFPWTGILGQYNSEDFNIAKQALADVVADHLADRFMDEISGGEFQKVVIARAICQDTPVIVLDEPAQSLDPKNKVLVYQLLRKIAAQGKCVICISHDIEEMKDTSVRVIGLHNGKVIVDQQGGEEAVEQLKKTVFELA